MPYKSTFELFSEIILPKLQDGPKTCEEMDVPRYAAQHSRLAALSPAGCASYVTVMDGRVGAVETYMLPEHVPPKLMDCALMDFEAMGIG